MPVTLDVARIIATLGGPAAVAKQLEAESIAVRSGPSISAWIRRNSMPGYALAELMLLSQRLDEPLDLYTYLVIDPPATSVEDDQPRLSPAW